MINVILCGGSGTRLWPLSRTMLPKQFVKIFGSDSLFTKTLRRLKDATNEAQNIVICNENHNELTQIHTKAYRPWGSYEVLEDGQG